MLQTHLVKNLHKKWINIMINIKLKEAVIRQIGGKNNARDYFPDVCSHGASEGFNGFIYYTETISFWKRHKNLILKYAEELATDLGEDMITMIQNFNAIKGDFSQTEIAQALYGRCNEDKYTNIYNVMAWFALEEVAREYCDEKGL